MPIGSIKKVMYLSLAPVTLPETGDALSRRGSEGYGIIRTADGRNIFFLNTAVQQGCFSELLVGQRVRYTLEDGPLARAAKVVPLPSRAGS